MKLAKSLFSLFAVLSLPALPACSSHADELARARRSDDDEREPTVTAQQTPPAVQPQGTPQVAARRFSDPVVIDLGPISPGDTVQLNLPPASVGFNVVAEWPGASSVGIQRIVSPSGVVVHDEFKPVGGAHTTSVGDATAGAMMAAASVPASEAAFGRLLEPGAWSLTFSGESTTTTPMRATMRVQTTADGQFHGGELNLNVYVPDGLVIANPSQPHPITAASAAQDPDIAARVDKLFALVKQLLDVDRGKVSFLPAPASALKVTDRASLQLAAAASAGHPDEQALQLTLTNDLEVEGIKAWGVAPGLPGAASRAGTVMSNVVLRVTSEVLPNAMEGDAITMLHEAGHFLGLEHPTQFDKSVDPLNDTPSCPTISATEPNPACADLSNVMFAAGDYSPAPILTPSQRSVVLGSPVFRAALTPAPTARTIAPPGGATPSGKLARMRLTRSGRAFDGTERWLAGAFCGSNRLDVAALVAARGRTTAERELDAIAADDDLPSMIRDNARTLRGRIKSMP